MEGLALISAAKLQSRRTFTQRESGKPGMGAVEFDAVELRDKFEALEMLETVGLS